jgi:hypothetical protein
VGAEVFVTVGRGVDVEVGRGAGVADCSSTGAWVDWTGKFPLGAGILCARMHADVEIIKAATRNQNNNLENLENIGMTNYS